MTGKIRPLLPVMELLTTNIKQLQGFHNLKAS
jgi:hypothetical protein